MRLHDPMVRNSLYLVLTSGMQAALGFAFWVVAARSFPASETGKASSLISATVFLALLALLGLNNSFIRYLPGTKDKNALITGGLGAVTVCGVVLAALYVLAVPTIAPRLAFVEHRLPLAIGFVVFTAAASVNLLTDSVFIGSHKARYIALTDGVIAGAVKVFALLLIIGSGAFGLFAASSMGLAAASLVSIVLIATAVGWRPKFRDSLSALRPVARFSAANYATELLSLIPQSVLPIIILDRLGPAAAAYYYVSYQVASLTYSTVYAVQAPMLAEGSRTDVDMRNLVRRSVRLTLLVCFPVVLIVILGAHWILLVFGAGYSAHGTLALMVLAGTTAPLAAISLIETLLRLLGRLKVIVWSSALFAATVCSLAWLLAPHGLVAVTAAWPVSASLAAVPCAVSLLRRHPAEARHRRVDRIDTAVDRYLSPRAGVHPDRHFAETQAAGLTALMNLAAIGNTGSVAFRMAAFDGSSVRPRTEGESAAGSRTTARTAPRHRSGIHG